MMYRLAARVVWSINATRSTLAHAKKIYPNQNLYPTMGLHVIP